MSLSSLLNRYEEASQELGSLSTSYGWNEARSKQQAVRKLIETEYNKINDELTKLKETKELNSKSEDDKGQTLDEWLESQ